MGIFNREKIKYLWYLFAWFFAMGIFLLCEMFIPAEVCRAVHSPLDDLIPFSEVFVIFYVAWYFLIFASLLYFAFKSSESFREFLIFMTVCQVLAVVIFILFPNKQELRPEALPRDNVFARLVGLIHSVDTNTNVCPSLHVAYSFALASVWCKEKIPRGAKLIWIVLALLISSSTVFIKQHSIIDFFVALVVCIMAEAVTFPGFWKERFTKIGKKYEKVIIDNKS